MKEPKQEEVEDENQEIPGLYLFYPIIIFSKSKIPMFNLILF